VMHLTETKWWDHMMDGIYGPRQGGARVCIDSAGESGVGKSGLAVYLGKLFSKLAGYEFTKEDMTLSGAEYLKRWKEHPGAEQPSVIILDELGGAGSGSSRRAMTNQNVELTSAFQLMRKKRIVTLITTTHWSRIDKGLRQQLTHRLWCLDKPIGYFIPYSVSADFDKGKVKTRSYDGVNRIGFPDMAAHDDSDFQYLASLKDDLLSSDTLDADNLLPENQQQDPEEAARDQKLEVAQRMRDKGMTCRKIGEMVDMSYGWVSQYTDADTAE